MAHYCFARGLFPCSAYYKIEAPAGKDAWVTYRDALFEQLKDKQDMDGSWPAAKGVFPGSISATAMWCFVLQLDRDCHPVFGRMEDVPKPRR